MFQSKSVKFASTILYLSLVSTTSYAENWVAKSVEAFDGYCFRMDADYDDIVAASKAARFDPIPNEMLPLVLGPDSTEGSGFVIELNKEADVLIFLGASKPNACAVAVRGVETEAIRNQLEVAFRLKEVMVDDLGLQVTEIYVPDGSSGSRQEIAKKGVIMLTYPKNLSYRTTSIAFMPGPIAKTIMGL